MTRAEFENGLTLIAHRFLREELGERLFRGWGPRVFTKTSASTATVRVPSSVIFSPTGPRIPIAFFAHWAEDSFRDRLITQMRALAPAVSKVVFYFGIKRVDPDEAAEWVAIMREAQEERRECTARELQEAAERLLELQHALEELSEAECEQDDENRAGEPAIDAGDLVKALRRGRPGRKSENQRNDLMANEFERRRPLTSASVSDTQLKAEVGADAAFMASIGASPLGESRSKTAINKALAARRGDSRNLNGKARPH